MNSVDIKQVSDIDKTELAKVITDAEIKEAIEMDFWQTSRKSAYYFCFNASNA